MNAILKKCSNNSFTASTMKVFALFIHDILRTRSKISSFVIPANFTAQKFVEYGIPKEKIFHIPTYFNFKKHSHENIDYGDYFLYIGRIVPEKGLFTLINAFIDTDFKLKIVGYSMDGYDKVLKDYLIDKEHNITFTGELEFSEIEPLLEKCICTICPSEWYDNFPNSVLESYAFKKPVIASRLGSLTELVEANKTGLHFEPGNYLSLRNAIDYMNKNREEVKNFGENGYQLLKELFSENYHYIRLIEVFKKAIEN
jgi:glycosyltransferase involved in cell wall biosynthesis